MFMSFLAPEPLSEGPYSKKHPKIIMFMPFLAPEPLSEGPYSAEAIDQYLDLA